MGRILRNRYGCMALAGALLAALLASLVIVAPLRTAVVQLLNNVGLEPDDYRVYPTPGNPQDLYGRVYAKTRITAVRQTGVTSLEQASQLAGFRVLMPTYVPDDMQPVSITHVLARNPVVTGLKELDPAQLRELDELGLRYLGLAQAEAHPLSRQMDWAAFLVVPPDGVGPAEPVTLNGHGGFRLGGAGPGNKAVLWEAEGVLYGLYGSLSATELSAIAESLK